MFKKFSLGLAIATFVVLDLGVLAFSYTIAKQVEKDAVAINLSGRQRMLSQRMSKGAFLAASEKMPKDKREAAAKEASEALDMFWQTLDSFASGGEAVGGDGQMTRLDKVEGPAALMVGEARGILGSWRKAPAEPEKMEDFALFLAGSNLNLLDAMNRLTAALEQRSVSEVMRLRVAQSFAFLLSLVNFIFILKGLHQARLAAEEESVTDALTGILNRGGFYKRVMTAMQGEESVPIGMVILDLDGFKGVNDNYGHIAGDKALKETARRLCSFEEEGPEGRFKCGRLGGDEFAILCSGLDESGMQVAAERLKDVLSAIPGGEAMISASVGWTMRKPGQGPDELMAAADEQMYAAKSRNKASRKNNRNPGHRGQWDRL